MATLVGLDQAFELGSFGNMGLILHNRDNEMGKEAAHEFILSYGSKSKKEWNEDGEVHIVCCRLLVSLKSLLIKRDCEKRMGWVSWSEAVKDGLGDEEEIEREIRRQRFYGCGWGKERAQLPLQMKQVPKDVHSIRVKRTYLNRMPP